MADERSDSIIWTVGLGFESEKESLVHVDDFRLLLEAPRGAILTARESLETSTPKNAEFDENAGFDSLST